jgi:hypothetical protein
MSAQVAAPERPSVPTHWMSSKSTRLGVLPCVLLTISIAINAMIIVAVGSGQ